MNKDERLLLIKSLATALFTPRTGASGCIKTRMLGPRSDTKQELSRLALTLRHQRKRCKGCVNFTQRNSKSSKGKYGRCSIRSSECTFDALTNADDYCWKHREGKTCRRMSKTGQRNTAKRCLDCREYYPLNSEFGMCDYWTDIFGTPTYSYCSGGCKAWKQGIHELAFEEQLVKKSYTAKPVH